MKINFLSRNRRIPFVAIGAAIFAIYYLLRVFRHISNLDFMSEALLLGVLVKLIDKNMRLYIYEDRSIFLIMGLGILMSISVAISFHGDAASILNRVAFYGGAGLLAGGVCFYIMAIIGEWIFKQSALGGGDIKLVAAMGSFIGPFIVTIVPIWILALLIFFLIYRAISFFKKLVGDSELPSAPVHFVSLVTLLSIQHKIWNYEYLVFSILIIFLSCVYLFCNHRSSGGSGVPGTRTE